MPVDRPPTNGDRHTPTKPLTTHFGREPDPIEEDDVPIPNIREHQMVTRADFDLFKSEMDDWRVAVLSDLGEMKTDQRLTRDAMRDIASKMTVGAISLAPPPPAQGYRDRMPSSVDITQLETLEPTTDGQKRYATTSQQMRQVIVSEIAKDREQQALVAAAAPILWFKGTASKGAMAGLMAFCAASGAGILVALKLLFSGHQ